ncbi:MAG: hypothetical protein ACREIV_15180, partial [Planctomycetaceae bacterium]
VELRKQVSICLPLSDWKAIRHEAAVRRIPMTELCRQWMRPGLKQLQRRRGGTADHRGAGTEQAG